MKYATVIAATAFLALTTQANAYGPWMGPDMASERSYSPYGAHRDWEGKSHRHHAKAQQRPRHWRYGAIRRVHVAHSRHGGSIPGPCYVAARMGGPCGCTAESIIFGTTAHVLNGLNLWLARTWHVFETASPAPGMAAIWGNRHVEAIVSNVHGGYFTTSGPYGRREVRVGSVRVINPHGYAARRRYARI
jgi:hypothetical protein